MIVLVDTSIWIEFFRPRPALSEAAMGILSHLLEDDQAATIHPIATELLSGRLDARKKKQICEAIEVMMHIDPDWNMREVWGEMVEMAEVAYRRSLPVPGIVDRMILVAAEKAGASLWALDRSLLRLASLLNVRLFSAG